MSEVLIKMPESPQLKATELAEFLSLEFPPRENLLDPWLPRQGLAMIYAERGIGKTHVSLGIAYAVASGSNFLKWEAEKPCGVLFLDGEMPGNALQSRLAEIVKANDKSPGAPLKIVTPDLQEFGMPDIGTYEGQEAINALIDDSIDLIIVDNLSTLVRSGKENEADSWQPIQTWALQQRAKGKSVLLIHHAGKGGGQRGTSKREDVLDTVIHLKRPSDYTPIDGAVFEVHFMKSRGIYGDSVTPFEAKLVADHHDLQSWSIRDLEDSTYDKVVTLLNDGLNQKDISIELGVNKSTVSRHVRRAKDEGRLHVSSTKGCNRATQDW